LRATLDWSYELLSASEQAILRRLAVFVGSFDLQSARAVAVDETVDAAGVFEGLTNLVAKSLIVADATGEKVLYRLLDTPRAYALAKLRDGEELANTQRRHAEMWRTLGAAEFRAQRAADRLTVFGRRMDDLRAALRWCFSPGSEASVGTRFALATLWFDFVLAGEYGGNREWAQRIIHVRPTSEAELLAELDAVFDQRLPHHLKGPVQNLTVAQQLGDGAHKRRPALWGRWFERLIIRDYRVAINISESFHVHSSRLGDEAPTAVDRILTVAHFYAGRQPLARRHAERALRASAAAAAGEAPQLCHARMMLSRILWVQGFADQALRASHESVSESLSTDNPDLICSTVLAAGAVALWCGNLAEVKRLQSMLREYSILHSLEYYQLVVSLVDTTLAVRSGEMAVEADLKLSDDPLSSVQYLDQFATCGDEMVSTCAIVRAEHGRGGWYTAEVLRVKGERILKAIGLSGAAQAEAQFQTALDTARRQDALGWELRVAMSLARLWRDQQRIQAAQDLLRGVYSRFTEGFGTADLIAARTLLHELAAAPPVNVSVQ